MFDNQNIRLRYLRTLERIRSFLLSKKSREFLIFLFFVFVSFSFWLLQVLNDDYETELSIPVRMKNVPENVVLTSELPSEIKIGVKDRGTVLVNYLWGQTFYPLTIDFSEYSDKGNQVRIPTTSLMKKVSSQLNQSTKLSVIRPDTLEFIYTKGTAKKIPVRLCGEVSAERQYYISDIHCSPDSVQVYAPKAILDTITAAYTYPVEMKEISDTTRQRVSIAPVKGARFIPDYSDVTLMVDVYAEKTVEVPIVGINFPEDKLLRTFPSKAQIVFQVDLSKFMEVDADDFLVVVDYQELMKSKGVKCKVELKTAPQEVKHIRVNPQETDYIIEQKIEVR